VGRNWAYLILFPWPRWVDPLLQDERQRLYAEMEDIVAGLNARFVELVREEKQLLNQQLEESAQLHAQTLAYLEVHVRLDWGDFSLPLC
jgi:hypothetical protein